MATNAQGMLQFQLVGAVQMQRAITSELAGIRNRLAQALRIEAERIKTKSVRSYVPTDKAALKSSAFVTPAEDHGSEVVCAIYFGGPAAPYAEAVHEHPSAHSPRSWTGKSVGEILSVRGRQPWSLTGRGPKYLERALREAELGFVDRLARHARKS